MKGFQISSASSIEFTKRGMSTDLSPKVSKLLILIAVTPFLNGSSVASKSRKSNETIIEYFGWFSFIQSSVYCAPQHFYRLLSVLAMQCSNLTLVKASIPIILEPLIFVFSPGTQSEFGTIMS